MGLKSLAKRSEGQVLVLTAFALLLLIALCALAIDLGMAYAVKAKLNSAVDAAALEAGRSVKSGADDATRIQNATQAATSFFAANYPTGFLGTTNRVLSIDNIQNNAGTWTIDISGSAVAPVFFSGIFNRPVTVYATAEATVKTLDMMVVLDCSASLNTPSGTFSALQRAAVNFVSGFQEGAGGDRIGLVTFASGAVLNDPINKDANRGYTESNLVAHINAASASGATNTEEAMRIAKEELDDIPQDIRSTLRVIVIFSDGAPNIVSGQFPLSTGGTLPSAVGTGVGLLSYQTAATCGTSAPADYYVLTQRSAQVQCSTTTINHTTVSAIASLPATDYTGTVNLASFNNARALQGNPFTNTFCNANMAARNMVENVANAARGGAGNAALTIYSIGLGANLNSNEITNCAYGSSEVRSQYPAAAGEHDKLRHV